MASSRVVGTQATAPQGPNGPNPNPKPNPNPTPAPVPTPTPVGGCIQCNSAGAICHPENVAGCERCNDEGIKCSLKCWTCEKNHKTCIVDAGNLSCVKCDRAGETCVPGPLDRAEVRASRLKGSQGPTQEYIDAHIRRVEAGLFGPRPNRVTSSTAISSTAVGKRGARRGIASSSRGTSSSGVSRKRKAPEELDSHQDESYMPGRSSAKLSVPMSRKNKKSKASEELDNDEEESTSTPAAPIPPYAGGHGASMSPASGRSASIHRAEAPRRPTNPLIYPNADEAYANAGQYWLVQKCRMLMETSHVDFPTAERIVWPASGPAAPNSTVLPQLASNMLVNRNIYSARQGPGKSSLACFLLKHYVFGQS